MSSSIRCLLKLALPVLSLLAAASVAAEGDSGSSEPEAPPVAHEIIIDDSGIIVREGNDETAVDIGSEEERRLNVRVDSHDYPVEYEHGDRDEQVSFGEDVNVDEDEVVHNDMVILFGDLEVRGEIVGNVVVVMGDVYVYDGAIITGDLLVVGGEVEREEGSRIVGEVTRSSTKLGRIFEDDWDFNGFHITGHGPFSAGESLLTLLKILAIALAGQFLLASRLPRFTAGLRRRPGRSLLVGLLTLLAVILLLVPVILLLILLMLTVIGVPVAVLLILAMVGLGFMAWLVPLYTFSRYTFEARGMNRYLSVTIWALIYWFVYAVIAGAGPFLGPVMFLEFVVFLFGLGALVVTRLGTRHLLMD
jgi:hypothetical protein